MDGVLGENSLHFNYSERVHSKMVCNSLTVIKITEIIAIIWCLGAFSKFLEKL